MSTAQTLLFFGIIALTTVFTRALAFVIFPEHKETPRYIQYLGKALPYTIIGLLVVYCLKEVSITVSPFGLPEAIAVAAVARPASVEKKYAAEHCRRHRGLYGAGAVCAARMKKARL